METTTNVSFNPFIELQKKTKTDISHKKDQQDTPSVWSKPLDPIKTEMSSPFDKIKHIDEQGREYWCARELQELLGYQRWENFDDSIKRAKIAIQNIGENPQQQLRDATKLQNRGNRGAIQTVKDYHLTRYGAYMVAMNGDPRKSEIAAAQTYFAVKTRQAEVEQVPQLNIHPGLTEIEALLIAVTHMVKLEKEQKRQADIQAEQQEQLEHNTTEISNVLNRVSNLEAANKVQKPLAVVTKRCLVINGIITKLAMDNILTYQESKQKVYDVIFTTFNIDLDQALEKYKEVCRRYYEHYKIHKGTPPKDVLRPSAIDNLGWISVVSTDIRAYNKVIEVLSSYLNDAITLKMRKPNGPPAP